MAHKQEDAFSVSPLFHHSKYISPAMVGWHHVLLSCPIIPRDRGNWLLTPQLVTSSTKSQRGEKDSQAVLPPSSHAILHSRATPWITQGGSPSCPMAVLCWVSLSHWEAASLESHKNHSAAGGIDGFADFVIHCTFHICIFWWHTVITEDKVQNCYFPQTGSQRYVLASKTKPQAGTSHGVSRHHYVSAFRNQLVK